MSGKKDQIKGQLKEAAGVVTGDKRLEREGRGDRAAGNIKQKVGEVADKVKEKAEDIVDRGKSTLKRRS